jgi:hypothetical protein
MVLTEEMAEIHRLVVTVHEQDQILSGGCSSVHSAPDFQSRYIPELDSRKKLDTIPSWPVYLNHFFLYS